MATAKPTTTSQPPSTLMPSARIELGRYVTLRPAAAGLHRAFFQVPARLRPCGWPSLIRLPREADGASDLTNAEHVAAIQTDAKALNDELDGARRGEAKPEGKTWKVLVRRYQESDAWRDLVPKTQKTYTSYLNHILAAADFTPPLAAPARLTREGVEKLLEVWRDAPETRLKVRKALRLLMERARVLGWRNDNPCDGIRIKKPKSKFDVWEQDDVDLYVEVAEGMGLRSIAGVILLEWEIGQRLGDARTMRPGVEYDRQLGVFSFDQDKTGAAVTIRISDKLRAYLDELAGNQMFLFRDEATGSAYTEERLSKVFAKVRAAVVRREGRSLLLRWLRHSCIVQLARAQCTPIQVAAVTGHALASVTKILAHYLPRDSAVADEAQRKRGLVA